MAQQATGSGFVPSLQFEIIEPGVPFYARGLRVLPFLVWHGPDYQCMVRGWALLCVRPVLLPC